jgi:glycosyltransferase involved in cell wall biosynthesis
MTSPAVAVFRLQLFKPSEIFIAEQARAMGRYRPTLFGREAVGTPRPGIRFDAPAPVGRGGRLLRAALGADSHYDRFLRGLQPRVIHAHFGVDAVAVSGVARRLDLPLVTTFHGYDATTHAAKLLRSGSPTLIRYALGRSRLARQGAVFVCVSKFIRQKVLELGFPESKVVTHYIGTDIERFRSLERAPTGARPIVLHVARLVEKKGTANLLAAFEQACRAGVDAQLVIIGEGPLRPQLQARAQALALGDRVQFLGAQSHEAVLDWMARASLFCLPSITAADGDTEGLPISIIEAAAAGLPILSTWHSGIPEAVQDGEGGILVKENDVPALADALGLLLRDDAMRTRMGDAARAFVQQNFDVRAQARALESLYDRAAA